MAKPPRLEDLLAEIDRNEASGSRAPLVAPPARTPSRGTRLRDTTSEYQMLPLSDIEPDPDQPRRDAKDAKIDDLAQMIKEAGLAQPIAVRVVEDRYVIIYGERRYLAAKKLGWSHIPALIRSKMPEHATPDQQLFENIGHEPMNIMDEADAIAAWMRRHKVATAKEAGKRLGKSEQWVAQRLDLRQLEREDQDLVRRGGMTLGVASTKVRAQAGRLREGSAAHEKAVAAGFSPAADRLPGTKSTGFSKQPGGAPVRHTPSRPAPLPRTYSPVVAHFSDDHPLASKAKVRCRKGGVENSNRHAMKIGMIACGACWEEEIRIDQKNSGAPDGDQQ